ncbi:MAG: DUF4332 domain-containing protein [Bacteroidales bacterium]|nr:DUF4332 domain-containing protein [Bacteroidales bacterium]
MGYYIDLENISIGKYKEILKLADLLPSRMILKDNIDSNFDLIKKQKVQNVDELINRLKNKKKLQDFSRQSGLHNDYLTILIREIKSYKQNPNKIKDFPSIANDTFLKLENIGIKNTLQLFNEVLTSKSRKEISKQTGIDENEILKLAKLTDLSRIRWVNHTFAYVLLEAKYDTVEKVANADYKELYETVKQLNEERKLYKGHIGLHDMKLCVDAAKDVSLEIVY